VCGGRRWLAAADGHPAVPRAWTDTAPALPSAHLRALPREDGQVAHCQVCWLRAPRGCRGGTSGRWSFKPGLRRIRPASRTPAAGQMQAHGVAFPRFVPISCCPPPARVDNLIRMGRPARACRLTLATGTSDVAAALEEISGGCWESAVSAIRLGRAPCQRFPLSHGRRCWHALEGHDPRRCRYELRPSQCCLACPSTSHGAVCTRTWRSRGEAPGRPCSGLLQRSIVSVVKL
jgi:hypothetical protein